MWLKVCTMGHCVLLPNNPTIRKISHAICLSGGQTYWVHQGKGHEYMLKYLLGTKNGLLGDETVQTGFKPNEIDFVENAPTGKIDLVTTLDFRMSSTCLYSDIVLPTATWYEKKTSTHQTCTHLSTHSPLPLTLRGKQKLTGRFINTSLRHSLAFVLGIWEHKPMWLPYPCNMTVPMNWLNPLVAQIGKVQVKTHTRH